MKTDQIVKTEWPQHTREITTVDCGEQVNDKESSNTFNYLSNCSLSPTSKVLGVTSATLLYLLFQIR